MVPMELNITIDRALQVNPEFRSLYDGDARMHELIDMAKRLEGLPNHTSVHAAGVVIYPGEASNYVPLGRASDGTPTAEYNMVQLEELGLLKMDFLGLRTLTVLKDAVKNVKASQGIDIDIDHIDLNDKKVLDFIGTGRTEGVFQLESAGMQNFMKELKPQNFEDIVAGISLYRPGPMDFIPNYIRGKNNADTVTYVTPELQPILEPTYGCIVYQEQVMQIVQQLAGYTMGQADNIRRAMSKKSSMSSMRSGRVSSTEIQSAASGAVWQMALMRKRQTVFTIPWWILQSMRLTNPMRQPMRSSVCRPRG